MRMQKSLAYVSGGLAVLGITCCVTPLLPVVLTAVGAAGIVPVLYRDAVLLPFSALMLLVAGGLFWSLRR